MTLTEEVIALALTAPEVRKAEAVRVLRGDPSMVDAETLRRFSGQAEPFLTLKECARRLGVSACSLWRWQAVSEWDTERAREIEEYVAARWSGLRSYNRGSRPGATPAGYWCREWHPTSTADLGPQDRRCLVVSDHGTWLRQVQGGDVYGLADAAALKRYAAAVRGAGKGFIYYGFGHTAVDSGAIRALGEVARAKRG